MKNKKYIIVIFLFYVLSKTVYAEGTWEIFANTDIVYDSVIIGENIWCATNGGVICWNINNLSYEKITLKNGWRTVQSRAIAVGPDGKIWLGTTHGLYCSEEEEWVCYYEDAEITAVAVDTAGTVYFGVMNTYENDYAIYRLDKSSVTKIYDVTTCTSIVTTSEGVVWFAVYGQGLYKYDGTEIKHISNLGGYNAVRKIVIDSSGSVWCGSASGLIQIENDTEKYWGRHPTFKDNPIYTITISQDNVIWAGYQYDGLTKFENGEWTSAYSLNMQHYFFWSLMAPSDNTVWCGTVTGLYRFDGKEFSQLTTNAPLNESNRTICFKPDGIVYAGGSAGISMYDGNSWKLQSVLEWVQDYCVATVTFSESSVWYTISSGQGLFRFDGTEMIFQIYGNFIGCDQTSDTVSGSGDDVWLASDKGVHYYDGKDLKSFTVENGLPSNDVTALDFDANGILWCGTDKGLCSYDGENWITYLGELSVTDLAVSLDGKIWATDRNDIYSYDENKWIRHSAISHKKSIRSIVIDNEEGVWYAGNYGAYRLYNGITTQYLDQGIDVLKVGDDGSVWFRLTDSTLLRYKQNSPTSVESLDTAHKPISITGNYPNPFNPSTTIEFTLPQSELAELAIYNITGQKVRTLLAASMMAGKHTTVWDGKNESGQAVSSGIYMSCLRTEAYVATHRLLLMK
ncbi:MAG: T9SS type A sorting domain-containing protein [Candidatus Latescibacteria bacterium]|nr:T9SS type A sorting domain-containing protein [Candidatus Latescibacterota bacterium]